MINNKEKNFVSAVVYCYNCKNAIASFLKGLNDVLDTNFGKYEIICVNDCSTDETVKAINDFCEQNTVKSLTVVNTSFSQGLESAMIAGLDIAIGDFVFEFDSAVMDFDPQLIMEVYRTSQKGNDIVFACPTSGQRWTSKLFYNLFNRFSDSEHKIKTQRFSVISRRGINRVKSMGAKTVYRKAVYASCGLPCCHIDYAPIQNTAVAGGAQKVKRELALNSLILFTDIGYKISLFLTVAMSVVLAVAGIYTVAVFFSANPVAGWTTTMLVMSFGFFGLFIILAFVLKYLSVILNLVFTQKQYIIESVQKITK
ncbi:MAG: glycosyltransferase [Oscillospiraceae bacterium]|nr:glycosyltransferase [Oscillospiraceae bacterium]MBQ7816423.1 glycosyltransferase [Oscillospiraceae bacterium]